VGANSSLFPGALSLPIRATVWSWGWKACHPHLPQACQGKTPWRNPWPFLPPHGSILVTGGRGKASWGPLGL